MTALVAEDAAEVVLVGKDLVLQGEEDARAIDEVDQGQAVLQGDAMRPENFLDVIGKNAPALTVASLAMIITRRPRRCRCR